MENIQINGQRRWGPPNDWSGPPPPHGTEVFVKNVPAEMFEEQLYRIFSMFGRVYEVRLPVHWGGEHRGYAFVRFTEVREADAAIKALDKFELRKGWKLEVQRSLDNTRLFLSSVPKDKNGEQLKKDLSEYVENIKKVYAYPTEEKNVFRGYAFVEFESHRDAAIAKRILTPDVCSSLFEKKCIAAWANPQPFIDVSLLETLNMLFIRNIPKELKLLELKKLLKQILEEDTPIRVKRLNNFGFLTFQNHECAERALHKIKDDPRLTIAYEIQVEWAIPRELANAAPERKKQSFSLQGSTQNAGDYQGWEHRSVFPTNGDFHDFNSSASYQVRPLDHLCCRGLRDSSLSPVAAGSSISSDCSLSPPLRIVPREIKPLPADINGLVGNFTPFRAFTQVNFTTAGGDQFTRPNPRHFY